KFANLMPFGCWWFLNNPSIVSEITRERLELLGPTFVPQHSDARILEQLLYKWPHSRRDIATALADQYVGVVENGRSITAAEIARDVRRLFSENFLNWTGRSSLVAAAPAVSHLLKDTYDHTYVAARADGEPAGDSAGTPQSAEGFDLARRHGLLERPRPRRFR